MSYELSFETQRAIESHIGLSIGEIQRTDVEKLDNYLAKRSGKKRFDFGNLPGVMFTTRKEIERRFERI